MVYVPLLGSMAWVGWVADTVVSRPAQLQPPEARMVGLAQALLHWVL